VIVIVPAADSLLIRTDNLFSPPEDRTKDDSVSEVLRIFRPDANEVPMS
jgi:hypothetical protein